MKQLVFILFFGLMSLHLHAQSGQSSGISLLEIGPTATELARGEASVASPNGAASIYTNPALLVMSPNSSINLGYTSWILDSSNIFGGINLKKGKRAVAFGVYTSGVTGLEQRNNPGESNGDFSIQHVSISGGYAHDFKYFTAGISGQYINEDVYPYRATGYGISAGLATYLVDDKIRVGASLLNMGEMEKLNRTASELPTSFNVGLAADILSFVHQKSPDLPILATVMADYVVPIKDVADGSDYIPDENYFNFGLSLTISEIVVVNTGYRTQDNKRPVSFGVGFITEKVHFNYALIPFNTGFGTVHSVGLQYQL